MDGQAGSNVTVFDFHNGSYYVEYTPIQSGNIGTVKVDGASIYKSPFSSVTSVDTTAYPKSTYAVGPGLHVGMAGKTSYFELFAMGLDGWRVDNENEKFTFHVLSVIHRNTTHLNQSVISLRNRDAINGTLLPCPKPPQLGHIACSSFDTPDLTAIIMVTSPLISQATCLFIYIYFKQPVFNRTYDGFQTADMIVNRYNYVQISGWLAL